jgi:hypothetical protein
MKEYKSIFKSYSIEGIINEQLHKLKTELVEMVARTPNGNAIDYTHTTYFRHPVNGFSCN